MSATNCYEREPRRRELETKVVEVGRFEGRPYALLADTILYPEGGGQPADHGTLGPASVVDVQRVEDGIRHFLDQATEPGPARLVLDWRRRFDHMQQHTAQHLLTAIAADRFGWQTTSFHLGQALCDIELDVSRVKAVELERLEAAVAEEIRAARPVATRRVTFEEYESLDIRTRGLPGGHRGDVRLVEIEGIDVSTCGGTHLSSTAEIESLKLLGTDPMRGGTRLYWVAGERVRNRLGVHERRHAKLRALLETSDDDLLLITELKLRQLRSADRRLRSLGRRLAELEGRALASSAEPIAGRHFDDVDVRFLQTVARSFLDQPASTTRVGLLTGTGEKGSFFLLCSHDDAVDLSQLGPRVAHLLEGRGGGSGNLYQGRAAAPGKLDEALRMLCERIEKSK